MRGVFLAVWGLLAAGPAHAAKLVRCEASLERSVGAVAVPGWGADEGTAKAAARRAAWNLAWADRWPLIAAGVVAGPEEALRREAALAERLDAATDWTVPGYAVRDGACTTTTVTADKGVAFAARWEREDRTVVRDDPAVAVEAARRRQCWGAWSHRMVKAAELARVAEGERFAATFPAARAATDGLIRCATRGEPVVESATGDVEGLATAGPVQCARPRKVGSAWTAAPAWGPELESAREAALQLDLGNQLRRAERGLVAIAARAEPADRAARVEALAMDLLAGVVVATDVAEQALTICRSAAPVSAKAAWVPPATCAGWPSGGWPATTPIGLEAQREQQCAAGFRKALATGWEAALACDVACRSEVVVDGWSSDPVWRPGESPRVTAEQAEKLLAAAVGGEDFDLLGQVTGGLVFEARFAAAFKAGPSAFWESIRQAQRTGSWGELAFWEQVAGTWVLAFKERK